MPESLHESLGRVLAGLPRDGVTTRSGDCAPEAAVLLARRCWEEYAAKAPTDPPRWGDLPHDDRLELALAVAPVVVELSAAGMLRDEVQSSQTTPS